MQGSVLKNIKESPYQFEVLIYFGTWIGTNPLEGNIWVIQHDANHKGIVSREYTYQIGTVRKLYLQGSNFNRKYIGEDKQGHLYYSLSKKDEYPNVSWGAIINNFRELGLFTLADQTNLLDSLKIKSIPLKDPCYRGTDQVAHECGDGIDYVEVKFGKKFRNFNLQKLDYFPLNKEHDELRLRHYLYALANQLESTSIFK